MIRLGAIGGGMVFARYYAAAEYVPGLQIMALADPDPLCRAYWTSKGCHCVPSVEALLQTSFDAVLVLTPNHTHTALVRACMEHGADVLCEKPLSASVSEAERLFEQATARGVLLFPAMHLRHRAEIKYLLQHCAGDVAEFEQVWLEDWTNGPAWYRNPKLSGGGVLLDVGINQIDWMLGLTPDLVPVQSSAPASPHGVEETCSVQWRFASGRGSTSLSWRGIPQRRHTIIRTHQGRLFNLDHEAGTVRDNGVVHGPWPDDEYAGVLLEFLAVRNGTSGVQSSRTVQTLKLIQTIYALAGLPFFNNTSERSVL